MCNWASEWWRSEKISIIDNKMSPIERHTIDFIQKWNMFLSGSIKFENDSMASLTRILFTAVVSAWNVMPLDWHDDAMRLTDFLSRYSANRFGLQFKNTMSIIIISQHFNWLNFFSRAYQWISQFEHSFNRFMNWNPLSKDACWCQNRRLLLSSFFEIHISWPSDTFFWFIDFTCIWLFFLRRHRDRLILNVLVCFHFVSRFCMGFIVIELKNSA